ncbi:MAG: pitrilysin family protein [Eubacteriales bacterium]|nr:pitrilysin family protein [Eubacteriales bacterium]
MVTAKTLQNGIELVMEPMEQVRSVSVGVWVGTGSVRETAVESGASHFIEHMLFKGTKTRSAKQIAAEMDGIGGNLNAFTSKECTCFYAKVLDEHLDRAVDILSDIVLHSAFDPKELEKEKGVVCEEILMVEDSPEDLASDSLCELYYENDPLAKPILGTKQSVTAFTRDVLIEYLRKHYFSGNIVVAAAGRFDEQTLIQLVEEKFADACPGNKETMVQDAAPGGRRVRLMEKDIEQVNICMGLPGVKMDGEDQYPLYILSNAIGGSMSSRLFQKVREERGLAYSIYSYPACYRSTGYLALFAGTGEKQAPEVIRLILEELQDVRQNGITEEEFIRSREQLKGSYLLSQESSGSHMNAIGKTKLLLDRLYSVENTYGKIERVPMEDIARIIPATLDTNNLSTVCVGRVNKQKKQLLQLTER